MHLKCLPFVSKDDSIYFEKDSNLWICTVCTKDIFPFNGIEENEEFFKILAEMQCNDSMIPFDALIDQNIIFSPFELNEDITLPIIDSDPDVQFYNSQCNNHLQSCDYHIEDSFNRKLSEVDLTTEPLSMIHLNIRSIAKNLNKFESYMNNVNHEFPIIAFSETWLQDHNQDNYNISGYNSEHNLRLSRAGGGVSLYIKDTIEYTVRDDLWYQNDTLETLFIEIDKDHFKKSRISL